MDDEVYQKLLSGALAFVSIRLRSKKEIVDYLEKKRKKNPAYSSEIISQVINRLEELGYVDDQRFCQAFISSRTTSHPKGTRLILLELIRKGIDKELAVSELDRLSRNSESPTQFELAKEVALKKLPYWQKYAFMERKKKLYSLLGRRGFDFDTIGRVVDELIKKD